MKYDPAKIERKWQKYWEARKIYRAKDKSKNPKKYILIEFPYPSGEGLHMGHLRPYVAGDVYSRYLRMKGNEVMYPIGWDAFGLPAENFAIKKSIHPRISTAKNIRNAKNQIKSWGIGFDWSREVNTTDPEYYKWTQWIFLQFFKAGLAYEATGFINWCPKDKTGLANEEVINGACERCGTQIEKKELRQWYLKITEYAKKLLEGLKTLNWPEAIKLQQENWIGKSEGARVRFKILDSRIKNQESIEVFTTRPDTLFGATFMVVSPELGQKWLNVGWKVPENVKKYIEASLLKSDQTRQAEAKEKTGIFTEVHALNPASKEKIPVWVADYVLGGYGTGAIMAVPAHDQRDYEFAKKFNLPIKVVIEPETGKILPNEQHRKSIAVILEDPRSKKFLTLNWGPKLGGTLFIGGGREEGEDEIATALREIKEETGYTNLTFIAKTELMHHHYVAFSKNNVARNIEVIGLHFRLNGDETVQKDLQHDEKGNFGIEWLTKEEILQKMEDESHLQSFYRLLLGKIYDGKGLLTSSGKFDGMDSGKAKWEITKFVGGKKKVQYKLRDWVFSRQRYWGEPIPLIHCSKCGIVPVPEKELPVKLPDVKKYEPTGTGDSPLAAIVSWVNVKCPSCGGPAKRETNTMPQWAGSSWYYLRYADPKNKKQLAQANLLEYWLPVDVYFGGIEHTTLHLLYSRFWHKFLYDNKIVSTPEPYIRRVPHGIILGPDGDKMSKSRGNVVNPQDLVKKYGADTLRMFELFLGPHGDTVAWKNDGIVGIYRFLNRVWNLFENSKFKNQNAKLQFKNQGLEIKLNQAVKKIGGDIQQLHFNTCVSELMKLLNEFESAVNSGFKPSALDHKLFLKLLAPFAPHLAEELWVRVLKNKNSIHLEKWPEYDERLLAEEKIKLVVQVNGRVRDVIEANKELSEEEAKKLALTNKNVKKHIIGEIKKVIYIKDRIINFVI